MATTFSWHGGNSEKGKPIRDSDYTYGQEIPDENVMKAAEAIYKTGLNVMITHGNPKVIYIDTGRFRQI